MLDVNFAPKGQPVKPVLSTGHVEMHLQRA